MIIKRELGCLGKKQKCGNIKVDNCKQMRSSRQNDKLEQWVMHRAVKDEVLGSSNGSNKQKVFPPLIVSVIEIKHSKMFKINQLSIKGRNVVNKANIYETVKNSKLKRTEVFNKRLVTKTADQLKGIAKTNKGNRKHA